MPPAPTAPGSGDYRDHKYFAMARSREDALARISSLEFKIDHAAWDERRRELNVVYEASLNGERKHACEIMQFDPAGRQIRGEALYGAII